MIWLARARRYQPGPVASILITLAFMASVTTLLLIRAFWVIFH